MTQTEQLKDLPDLGRNANDTTDTNNKGNLVLGGNVDLVIRLGLAAVGDVVSSKLFVGTSDPLVKRSIIMENDKR